MLIIEILIFDVLQAICNQFVEFHTFSIVDDTKLSFG